MVKLKRLFCVFIVLFEFIQKDVYANAKDKSASDGRNGNIAKGEAKTADTRDKDCRNGEKVAAVVKIDLLDHLKP